MPRYGITTEFIDGTQREEWERAFSRPVRAIFLETPSNPMLEIVDIASVARLAKRAQSHGAPAVLIVDNAFASPVLQSPLALGADLVTYSMTKHIDGQGRCLGGAVLGSAKLIEESVRPFLRHTGPTLSAFNSWVMLKGLETLKLRVEYASASAEKIARYLTKHPAIGKLRYPGLDGTPGGDIARRQMKMGGTILSFSLKEGKKASFAFLNALRVIDISNNLGDSKSLATHPASTTHSKLTPEHRALLGIDEGVIRLSVGLEDAEDLLADIEQALKKASSGGTLL